MTKGSLTIGQVATAAGVAIDTVRYYERRGVLPPIARRSSGYRAFPPETVGRIAFVKELQSLGFNLDEIVALLQAADANEATCEPAREYATAILGRIDQKVRALLSIRERLAGLVDVCDAGTCGPLAEATPHIRLPLAKRR